MYDELITNLRNCAEVNSLSRYKRDLIKQAADAIEELSRQNAKREKVVKTAPDFISCWVSLEERLPSPMKAVLVWTPYKHNVFMAYLQGNKWHVWGPDDSCCHNWPEYHAITHWMPLPEPPKEEK